MISRDNKAQINKLRFYGLMKSTWLVIFIWILVIGTLLVRDLYSVKQATRNLATREARILFQKDESFRFWSATHGGFFVPVSDRTLPSPYLAHIPERDIETASGKKLTLMNPAWAVRQMNEDFTEAYGVTGHITSLMPLRLENSPDNWERLALESFENGESEVLEFLNIEDHHFLRLIQPLVTQEGCLKCHAHQGYEVGDIRGGISVSIPLDDYLIVEKDKQRELFLSSSIVWLFGLTLIILGSVLLKSKSHEREKALEQLRESYEYLEIRVKDRTSEIYNANKKLKTEISDRKLVEIKLLKNQYYLIKAQEMGNIGTWELDLENNHLTWTDEAYKVFGLTRNEDEINYESFLACVHPDDRDMVNESWNNALTKNSYDIEHRISVDGHIKWVREKADINYDAEGNPLKAIGFVQDITERKKSEYEIKHQLQEKEIILKEVNHRIKNNFASIISLLSLQADSVSHPEALAALQDAIGRVNSMYVLYENLLISDDYQFTSVKDYLENLIESIISIFPPDLNLKVEKNIDNFDLDPKRLIPVGIIVNELLTNTMKYAFEGRDSGNIQLTVKVIDKQVILIIQDNGKGLPEGFDINEQTGFGLMLVTMLSEQLHAVLSVESIDGVRSTLEFQI